jgi:ferredoxin
MRIELSRDTCIGSATCVGFAPSVFKIGGDGLAVLVVEEADVDAAMDDAVANCPTASIRLVDAD